MKIISRECSALAVLSYLAVKQGSADAGTAVGFWLPRRTLKNQGWNRNTRMDTSGTPGKKGNACDLDEDQKSNFV